MRVALLGDISLIGRYDKTRSTSISKSLSEVCKVTKACDYVIANLEAPLTRRTKTTVCKGVYLRSDPINVKTLLELGVTHVTVGNNHIFDFGTKGKDETINVLKENHISFVGLNHGPVRLTKGEDRAMLEGFCCLSANGVRYGEKPGELHCLEEKTAKAFLFAAKEDHCLPILSAHFGEEGVHYPSMEHRNLFRSISREASFVLHGNHPHAVQGIEKFNQSLFIYSQGNLCFDNLTDSSIKDLVVQQTEKERESIVVVLDIRGSELYQYEVYGFSDYCDRQEQNSELEERVRRYSQAFMLSEDEYRTVRQNAVKERASSAPKHSLSFIVRRLNWRYMGAYLAGKSHARKYQKLYSKFMTKGLIK